MDPVTIDPILPGENWWCGVADDLAEFDLTIKLETCAPSRQRERPKDPVSRVSPNPKTGLDQRLTRDWLDF